MKVLDPGPDITWLGHDTFRITGEKVIYTDPYQIAKPVHADIILITHSHYDHCVPEDIAKLRAADTVVVGPAEVVAKLPGIKVKVVTPGDSLNVGGIRVEVVPAYNIDKFRSPGNPYHPKADGKVGYVFMVSGKRIYLAGDTDLIPEMKMILCDIALLPVSGTYVMTPEEGARAANMIKPKVAIPMHYGDIVGGEGDATLFKQLCQVPVTILKKEA